MRGKTKGIAILAIAAVDLHVKPYECARVCVCVFQCAAVHAIRLYIEIACVSSLSTPLVLLLYCRPHCLARYILGVCKSVER